MKVEKLESSLELTNEGGLSFFFVGVGSAFSKKHYQNNILIVKGNDHLLVDCGITCPAALYHYGSNITKIKNILIEYICIERRVNHYSFQRELVFGEN